MPKKQLDLNYSIEKYDAEFVDEFNIEKGNQLLKEFQKTYSLETLKAMTIEEYALGRGEKSYGWWLEYHSKVLGNIGGGNASKHVIYYSKGNKEWIFPSKFSSVEEAWSVLRSDLVELVEKFEKGESIDSTNLLYTANMVKTKTAYLFYQNQLLPIYNIADLQMFLKILGVEKEQWVDIKDDSIALNRLLKHTVDNNDFFINWDPIKVMNFLYYTWKRGRYRYVKIEPGKDENIWKTAKENNYISIDWDDVGDLTTYPDYKEFKETFKKMYYLEDPKKAGEVATEIWSFYSLAPGDVVIVNKGTSKIQARGTVTEKAYTFEEEHPEQKHVMHVEWDKSFETIEIPEQKNWALKTIYELSEKEVNKLLKVGAKKETAETPDESVDTFYFTEDEDHFFAKMQRALERKGQCILYGPPGTGKTYAARTFIEWQQSQLTEEQADLSYSMCTFHPSYTYEDFIEGYKPYSKNDQVSFKLESGVFKQFCENARGKETPHYFIIDELNRGNIPKIFGELITMIEKDKREMDIILPQSKVPFSIPENVYIIGTMNTSDQSIKIMDSALKRRFAFIECLPNYEIIDQVIDPLSESPAKLLKALNEKLIEKVGRDKQIGHSYFMNEGEQVLTIDELKEVFEFEIIPLLQEYCFDNYEDLAYFLGEELINIDEMMIDEEIFTGPEDVFINAMNTIIRGN